VCDETGHSPELKSTWLQFSVLSLETCAPLSCGKKSHHTADHLLAVSWGLYSIKCCQWTERARVDWRCL